MGVSAGVSVSVVVRGFFFFFFVFFSLTHAHSYDHCQGQNHAGEGTEARAGGCCGVTRGFGRGLNGGCVSVGSMCVCYACVCVSKCRV